MALDFPSSPALNQVFTSGNRSWIWNGTEWIGNTPIINYTANSALLGNGTSLFQEVAPGTAGNLLTSNGTTWTSATAPAGGITNVVTATGNTTLTSTPTILRITPTGYGTTVKLPDATTMTVGTGKFDVQNLSAFSVRIADTSGTLLGFAGAFSTVNIGLASNSTANGSWTLANAARLGVSAERLNSTSESTTAVSSQTPIIQLDDNRVFLLLRTGAGLSYGQVYDQATNTFGAETLIRNANVFSTAGAQKIDANTVLVASINGTALQAVVLSISGTTITVNSPASATISNSISAFQFLRAIPAGGFVMGWLDTASSFRIVGISVSGTTPSIGTEVGVFNSQSGNLFAQTVTNRIILFAPNDNSNQGGFIAYSLSGNTLTAGTRVATPNASSAGSYFIKLTETTFFFDCSLLSMTDVRVGVLQINAGLGLTVYSSSAISSSTGVFNAYSVSSTKVFFTLGSTVYWNLMTFTGSAITLGTALLAAPATTSTSISGVYNNRLYVVGSTNILWRIDFSGSSLVVEGPALGSITTSIYASDVSYDGRLAGLFVSDLLVSAITAPSSVQSANAFVSALQIPKIGIDGVNFAASGLKKPAGNDRFCFEYTNQNSRYWVRKIELV